MYKTETLPNGLRIITHHMKQRDSISVGFLVGVGGRHEEDEFKGIAHFLEHIVFKGSQKYSCEQIKELIEGVGGTLNAFTSEEQTCFYAKIPSQHLKQTYDVLADMVFSPKITPTDTRKEKTVILEEIKMYHDLPQYFVMELLDGLMWPNHPLGQSLAGTAETVSAMTSKDLKKFHKNYYSPNNIIVSVTGNIQHEKIVKLVQSQLKNLQFLEIKEYIKVTENQNQPRVHFCKKDIEQMHMALGMVGLNENHKDKYVLTLLNVILGGNMSSRLFVEVREKRGLAYSISSSTKFLYDTGLFMIRAGVANQNIVMTVELILKELNKIKRSEVKDNEFKCAKDYLLGQLLLGLEDTMDHMLWIGESLQTHNKAKTLTNIIKEFKKITPADIQRVAKQILNPKCFNLAIVGPITPKQEKALTQLIKK